MNDYELTKYAEAAAADIVEEFDIQPDEALDDYEDEFSDKAHEWADQSEHVIYYHKAHDICQNCNVDQGEEWLEEVGNPEPCTYDALAVAIAYGEFRARIETALQDILKESE